MYFTDFLCWMILMIYIEQLDRFNKIYIVYRVYVQRFDMFYKSYKFQRLQRFIYLIVVRFIYSFDRIDLLVSKDFIDLVNFIDFKDLINTQSIQIDSFDGMEKRNIFAHFDRLYRCSSFNKLNRFDEHFLLIVQIQNLRNRIVLQKFQYRHEGKIEQKKNIIERRRDKRVLEYFSYIYYLLGRRKNGIIIK